MLEDTSMRTILKVLGVNEVLIVNEYLFYTDVMVKTNLTISTQGNKLGQFNYPNGIRLSKDGEVYVCDSRNHRVQVFNQDLKLLRVVGEEGKS